jgi:hypothetical protein
MPPFRPVAREVPAVLAAGSIPRGTRLASADGLPSRKLMAPGVGHELREEAGALAFERVEAHLVDPLCNLLERERV